MSLRIALDGAGGLALFLLAMAMMTEGLEVFAGGSLKRLLGRWTSTPARGVLAGILVTGVVQSSSAVTIATIGFVNAGLLTLRQALGVVFGTNVGTTMTGWLVSLVGFGFRIESFALPVLAVGAALKLIAPRKRLQGLGGAIAGFGLFFLGLAILKETFGGLAESYGTQLGAVAAAPAYLLAGFLATVLTQSSSAAIALILSAASGGVLGLAPAAAAVIGANLGTTSTAALAVLRATPSAQRLALGHIGFNLLTGVVALALLPLLLRIVAALADGLDLERSPAPTLALFHTVFNLLGVLLLLPWTGRLASGLERLFRRAEEELGRPRHLDATLASTPELAVSALREELLRLRGMVAGIASQALAPAPAGAAAPAGQVAAVQKLGEAVGRFVASVRTERMGEEVAAELARGLRVARYCAEATLVTTDAAALAREAARGADPATRAALERALAAARVCLALAGGESDPADGDPERAAALAAFRAAYEEAKVTVLGAAVGGRLSVEATDAALDALASARRLVEPLVKADRLLRSPALAAQIEAEPARAAGASSDALTTPTDP